ncbi:hypothetical protein F4678DRAFT_485152, partial [Xylaria arbuscula]
SPLSPRGSSSKFRPNIRGLTVNWLWLVFQLPHLRRLIVYNYNMDTRGASEYSGNITKSSTITDLAIVYTNFQWALTNSMAFLSFPERLTKLSIYLECEDQWDAIRQHKDSIEDLDLCLSDPCICCHNHDNLFLRPMREFRKLKKLDIQATVIFNLQARFSLSDSLPHNLTSLAVYYVDKDFTLNKTLAQYLQEVIKSGEFPYLSDITLGAGLLLHYNRKDLLFSDEVKRACEETGIVFEIKDVVFGDKAIEPR